MLLSSTKLSMSPKIMLVALGFPIGVSVVLFLKVMLLRRVVQDGGPGVVIWAFIALLCRVLPSNVMFLTTAQAPAAAKVLSRPTPSVLLRMVTPSTTQLLAAGSKSKVER